MTTEKTVQLSMKVPESLKYTFLKACKDNDTTASQEIRAFIREYIKSNSQGSLL